MKSPEQDIFAEIPETHPDAPFEAHINDVIEDGIVFERPKEKGEYATGNDGYGNTFEIVKGNLPEDGFDMVSGIKVKIIDKIPDPQNEGKFIYKVAVDGQEDIEPSFSGGESAPESAESIPELEEGSVAEGIAFERGLVSADPKLYTGADAAGHSFFLDLGDGPQDFPKTFTSAALIKQKIYDESGIARYLVKYIHPQG